MRAMTAAVRSASTTITVQNSGGDRRSAENAGAIHAKNPRSMRPAQSQNLSQSDALLYAADPNTESTARRIVCSGI